jgi:hypothetical protein
MIVSGEVRRVRLSYAVPIAILILGCWLQFQFGYYSLITRGPHAQGVDDAYISYRYGWNLTHFGSLSWNESGFRKTEGFTNPLWVYMSAAWALLNNKDWIYPLMSLTSTLIAGILVGILVRAVHAVNGHLASSIGVTLMTATPVIWLHTTSGLESGVFGLGLAVTAYIALMSHDARQNRLLFALAVLLCWLRSDGFIYVSAIIGGSLLRRPHSRHWKPLTLGTVLAVITLLGWRLAVFGAYLPNTAVAKLNFSFAERLPVGLSFLAAVLPISGLLIFICLGMAGLYFSNQRGTGVAVIFVMGVWLAYYLYMGGDHLLDRHLVGIIAFGSALSGPVWSRYSLSKRNLLIALTLAGLLWPAFRSDGRFAYSTRKIDSWILLGKAIATRREQFGTVITLPAGKIPFFAGGDFVDAMGLNDPYLATLKRNEFFPGHSAGNDLAAISIAQSHASGVYSRFLNFTPEAVGGPENIALWINNFKPQAEVQTTVSASEWDEALGVNKPYVWSIITVPAYAPDPLGQ